MQKESQFSIGQLVKHKLFNYRGVIVDVDPEFMLTDEWYEMMAKSRPPKDEPWYKVLVHNAIHETYVAQRNLEKDDSKQEINHQDIKSFFSGFVNGKYVLLQKDN
ncbi:MAG: heat shock protein HspQ [Nitrospinae bacterium]|nr:heat shock protein HspQ [Nitrospinota bacterium]